MIRLSTLFQASQKRCHGVFEQHDIGIEYLPTKHLLVNSKIKFLFAVQVLYKRGKEKKSQLPSFLCNLQAGETLSHSDFMPV